MATSDEETAPEASGEPTGEAPAETPATEAPAEAGAAPSVEAPKKKAKKAKPGSATGAPRDAAKAAKAAPEDDGQFGATQVLAELPGAGTPDGEALRDARAAFEVGDYRRARELAARISRSEDREVAAAAEDVLRRTGVDQVQIAFLVACTLAILTIAWIYIPH